MDCTNGMKASHQLNSQCLATQPDSSTPNHQNTQRRSANYKPNIWKYELLQSSLTSKFSEQKYECLAKKLKEEVVTTFYETVDVLAKMELIDIFGKLGLAYLFNEEIKIGLETIVESLNTNHVVRQKDLYATSLCFRLIRQYGYSVSQDVFKEFMDNSGNFMESLQFSAKALLELFEASNLATEGEYILEEAANFTTGILRTISSNPNHTFAKKLARALKLPLQRRVDWYDVKSNIQDYEKEDAKNTTILKLAKLHFNMIQATHQKDLKAISRWWKDLGVAESLSFTRNRIVESYLWTVGVTFETNYGSFRKWLTKVIKLILIIDDVYDVYGSLQELELFTIAVNRWDSEGIQKLPTCMKICFQTLYDTTHEIAFEIQKEKDCNSVLPLLQKVWEDFCQALLLEARWYNEGYTPSLREYLDNGWISSGGPVISLHAFLSVTAGVEEEEEAIASWRNNHDLIYYTSLIIRLCNDQGTSKVELERGDAPSSILCYMREANVSEMVARKHIRSTITSTWKKINKLCIKESPFSKPFIRFVINASRVAHFIYQNGDGFGVQDRETRDQVLALLIEPFALD